MTSSAEKQQLRLGVVGLGTASALMMPALVQDPRVKVVAACDTDGEALEVFVREFQAKPYGRLEELCADPDVDVVYIATPHNLHGPHSVMAAEHGKHVMVEKPMALSLQDCDLMIDAAARNGVQLLVGYTYGQSPAVQKMREIIDGGELGPVRMINAWNYNNWLYRLRPPHDLDVALGGGAVFNQVVHQVEMVRTLAGGAVTSVRASTGAWDTDRPAVGSSLAFVEFDNGVVASIAFSGYDHFDTDEFHFSIGETGGVKPPSHGETRKALGQVKDYSEELRLRRESRAAMYRRALDPGPLEHGELSQPHFGVIVASCERGDLRPSGDGVIVYGDDGRYEAPLPPVQRPPGWGGFVDEVYKTVAESEPPVHDGHWGRASAEVCLAIAESARTRTEIRLPLEGR